MRYNIYNVFERIQREELGLGLGLGYGNTSKNGPIVHKVKIL